MPTTLDQRKLRHTATAAPTEDNHHASKPPSCHVPSTTFTKGCDDDDAAGRTNPRISPGTRREAGERYSRRPSRRLMAPAGVTVPVPGGPERDFALPLIPTGGSTTPTAHQPAPPQSRGHHHRLSTADAARPAEPNETTADRDQEHHNHVGGDNLHWHKP